MLKTLQLADGVNPEVYKSCSLFTLTESVENMCSFAL